MDRRLILARAADALAAWNRGDAEAVVAHVAEDVIWRDVALGMPLHGRDAVRDAARAYLTAFPDLHVEQASSTAAPPRLAQELTITGTHRGELLGIPPTGRWTESYAALVTTFDEDGMVIEGAVYWNALGLLSQLGLATPLGAQTGSVATAISPSSPAASAAALSLRRGQAGGATTLSRSPAAT